MSKTKKLSFGVIPFSNSRVDRANRRIYGANAMAVGEAQGHRLWADIKTLQSMADLANARQYPVMMRFGHPGMSDNAFGKKLSKAYNFRVQGDKLIHDIEFQSWASLAPTFSQDPVAYLLDRSETDPNSFGESAVVSLDMVWVLDDGSEHPYIYEDEEGDEVRNRPDNSLYDYPVMRPLQFHFLDFVGDGALTPDGMFSEDAMMWKDILENTSSEYALEGFQLIRRFQQQYKLSPQEISLKISQLMGKYIEWEMFQMPEETTQFEEAPENPVAPEPADIPEASELDSLTAAVAATASLAGEPVEEESTPAEGEFVPRAEFDALQSQTIALQEAHNQLVGKMSAYVNHMNAVVAKLTSRMDDFDAEDIVSGSTGANGNPFAQLKSFDTPVPGNVPSVPVAMEKRYAESLDASKEGVPGSKSAPQNDFEKALAGQPGLKTTQ